MVQIQSEIDKLGFTPVYRQIAANIKQYIETNSIKIGDMIPSERELCDAFEVSRMTVRQAIDLLVQEHVLVRQKGKGTFVSAPKFDQSLTALTSFTMDMTDRKLVSASHILGLEEIAAPAHVAKRLGLQSGETVIRLIRVRLANGHPYAHECSHLLADRARPILDVDFTHRSLYNALSTLCGVQMTRAKQVIAASVCPDQICSNLAIPKKSVTFHIERTTYNEQGTPFEYVESRYRIDKFKYHVELDLRKEGL
ncbi:MAG: GntR family transcriptional regulator [Oscillospiraceae bacterium]|nr:GntR family transcriptional regulator [Oscillospiraceae bacterium]